MTTLELRQHLSAYAAGLEAELALLRHVEQLSHEQLSAVEAHAPDRLTSATAGREHLMAGLDDIELGIRASRLVLAEHPLDAAALAGFEHVTALHRSADALVARILGADRATQDALRRAEDDRRVAAHAIDAGESTLAAYRRVILPDGSGPSLVDRRG